MCSLCFGPKGGPNPATDAKTCCFLVTLLVTCLAELFVLFVEKAVS
jgi:hypothetical protein